MNREYLCRLLEGHKKDEISTADVLARLTSLPCEDLGYARIDHHRGIRNGYPEVIYGEGKTPEQAAEIFGRLAEHNPNVICTRAPAETAEAIRKTAPEAVYHALCRVVALRRERSEGVGLVVVASGGTADMPVAEEAAVVLESFGSKVERLFDVGVAGIHRLLAQTELIRRANSIIAVAGMEGALPSVVGGLADVPVIAVPTAVGYGASFGGVTALLAMLNSCASGVSVVNIGNGFGAAYQADMINKLAVGRKRKDHRS
jgi:hypothetical protein